MAANAGLASILFSINYHFGGVLTGEDAVDSRARRRIGLWRQELIFGESSICRSQSGQFPVEYAWFDKVEGEYGGFLSAPMSKGLCVSVPQKHFHAKSSGLEVGENGPKELW